MYGIKFLMILRDHGSLLVCGHPYSTTSATSVKGPAAAEQQIVCKPEPFM